MVVSSMIDLFFNTDRVVIEIFPRAQRHPNLPESVPCFATNNILDTPYKKIAIMQTDLPAI
jgi:hypothetical protein